MSWSQSQRGAVFSALLIAGLLSNCTNVFHAIDTEGWVAGGSHLRECLSGFIPAAGAGTLESCQKISKWPLWNNGMAAFFGMLAQDQGSYWLSLNVLSSIVYLVLWLTSVRYANRIQTTCTFFALLFSPMLFYASSTFTEVQQGLFVTLGIFFVLGRANGYAALAIFLSILSKESLLPLWVVLFVQVFFHKAGIPWRIWRASARTQLSEIVSRGQASACLAELSPLILAIAAGGVVSMGFNWLRYESIANTAYLIENERFGMSAWRALGNLFWGVFSPNGGILVSYGLILGCLLWRLQRTRGPLGTIRPPREIPWEGTVTLLGGGLLTTALWWASFGWDAWGYRLFVPYAMPGFYLAFRLTNPPSGSGEAHADSTATRGTATRRTRLWATLIAALLLIGFSYNYSTLDAVYSQHSVVLSQSLHSTPSCAQMLNDPQGIIPHYWECVSARYRYVPFFRLTEFQSGLREARLLLILGISALIWYSVGGRPGWEERRGKQTS